MKKIDLCIFFILTLALNVTKDKLKKNIPKKYKYTDKKKGLGVLPAPFGLFIIR